MQEPRSYYAMLRLKIYMGHRPVVEMGDNKPEFVLNTTLEGAVEESPQGLII